VARGVSITNIMLVRESMLVAGRFIGSLVVIFFIEVIGNPLPSLAFAALGVALNVLISLREYNKQKGIEALAEVLSGTGAASKMNGTKDDDTHIELSSAAAAAAAAAAGWKDIDDGATTADATDSNPATVN